MPADRQAISLDEIARLHGTRLRAVAERVVGCSETAAEVVQDVFLRLWRDRETLEIRDHLAGYLARAVRNRALDLRKRRRLESRWLERETAEAERAEMERILAGSFGAGEDDRGQLVARALDRLPAKRREVMLYRWRDGLAYGEIAGRLGVSVKTVENQVNRGLKALRETLGPRRFEESA